MLAARLEARLRAVGTPERRGEKAYLKSDLISLAHRVANPRGGQGRSRRDESLDHDDLVALVEALWSEPRFERRMAATVLLDAEPATLVDDLALLERLLRDSHTWALVDSLAGDVVGSLLTLDEKLTPASSTAGRTMKTSGSAGLRCWPAEAPSPRRALQSVPWLRRCDARGEGVLHPQGHRLVCARRANGAGSGWATGWRRGRIGRGGTTMREATKYLPKPDGRMPDAGLPTKAARH